PPTILTVERAPALSGSLWETGIMRNAMPMQWIEQAEARQVLTAARFERSTSAPWRTAAGDAAGQILPRLRSWLTERHPFGMPVEQLQPAIIRRPTLRAESLPRR